MMKKLITSILLTTSVWSFAQTKSETVCSWGVMSQFDKTIAAQRHCEAYAGPNGFKADNPKRAQWINACEHIVNPAVAPCNSADLSCMKAAIAPLGPRVCELNHQHQTVKK